MIVPNSITESVVSAFKDMSKKIGASLNSYAEAQYQHADAEEESAKRLRKIEPLIDDCCKAIGECVGYMEKAEKISGKLNVKVHEIFDLPKKVQPEVEPAKIFHTPRIWIMNMDGRRDAVWPSY